MIAPLQKKDFMDTIIISAQRTVGIIAKTLAEEFVETDFAVRLEDPLLTSADIRGVDVVWCDGPTREEIEDVLDQYQSVSWDPLTGTLSSRTHYNVNESGDLVRVMYNIDYIFCDGPAEQVSSVRVNRNTA
jgi:hypothetical protein